MSKLVKQMLKTNDGKNILRNVLNNKEDNFTYNNKNYRVRKNYENI